MEDSTRRLASDVNEMASYTGQHEDELASIRKKLEQLGKLSEERIALLNRIYDSGGLITQVIAARAVADEAFIAVSEAVPLPTRDYLALKASQNEFLATLSPVIAAAGIRHLEAYRSAAAKFPGLHPDQRRRLQSTGDDFLRAFTDVSGALLAAEERREKIQSIWAELLPMIDRVSSSVTIQAVEEAARVKARSDSIEIASAAMAILTALAFASIALSSYRLAAERDRRLRESSARFRDLALASSDIFIEVDANASIQLLEGEQDTWTEELSDEIVGHSLNVLMDKFEIPLQARGQLMAAYNRQEPFRSIEYRLRHPHTGAEGWHSISGMPFTDKSGAFAGFRCTLRNITAERQLIAERTLAESRLTAIIRNLPITFFRMELNGGVPQFTFVSANTMERMGLSPDEIGQRWLTGNMDVVVEEDRGIFRQHLESAFTADATPVSRSRIRYPDGSIHWIQQVIQVSQDDVAPKNAIEGLWIDVTEEESRLQQLRELEQSINTSDMAFYIMDSSTKEMVYCSAGYARLMGMPLGTVPENYKIGDSGGPTDRTYAELSAEVDDAIAVKGNWQGELSWKLHTGRTYHFLAHVRPISLTRRVIVVTEISARVAQEKHLQAVTTAVENASDGVLLFQDDRGPTVYANAAIRTMFRLRNDIKLEGRYLSEFMPDSASMKQIRADAEAGIAFSDAWQRQVESTRADGTPISVLMRVTRLPDKRVLVIMTDVTEQVRLEEEIKSKQEERDRLLANLPGVAYQMEWLGGRYVMRFLSRRIEEISGYTAEYLIDKPLERPSILPQEDLETRAKDLAEAREARRPFQSTWRMRTRHGEMKWILEQGEHFVLGDGRVVAQGHLTDITDRIRKETEERELRRRLSDAQRLEAIGSLAGGVAHDFNNIIGAARGFADLLVADLPEGPPRHYAERIVATCRRAAALVREIMAFSRVKEEDHRVVDIAGVIEEAKDILVGRPGQNISIEMDMDADAYWVDCNPSQLTQVLTNILINAADATPEAGGRIKYSAHIVVPDRNVIDTLWHAPTIRRENGRIAHVISQGTVNAARRYLRLRVVDEGTGMTERVLSQIFEPFYTTKEKSRGTGLGLAVVASIVQAHGGAIRVETTPGAGTSFGVYLPLSDEGAATGPIGTSQVREDAAGDIRGSERILIVDDEADIADALSIALGRLGYETAPIYHSKEALEIFTEDPTAWDFVITDQSMPKLRGLQLIRKMKMVRSEIRTIICTGYSDALTAERAAESGIDAFFNKPVGAETIAGAIRRISAGAAQ